MKNKLVVYTAIFGGYDDLIDPDEVFKGCEFICFTDRNNLESNIWKIKLVAVTQPLNMMNREYKWLPHIFLKDYDTSLYVDGNIKILSNPCELAHKYLQGSLVAAPKHLFRDCLYSEARMCVIKSKSSLANVIPQVEYYFDNNYPRHLGLTDNNILFRRHNHPLVVKVMNEVWEELKKWKTKRDQLSFPFVAWKNKLKILKIQENCAINNNYFKFFQHKLYRDKSLLSKTLLKFMSLIRLIAHATIYHFFLIYKNFGKR